jgi:hypothetical protein
MTKATVEPGGLGVETGLRHGLQIVPIVHQRSIPEVRAAMVNHRGRTTAAALADRVSGEVSGAEPLPTMTIKARRCLKVGARRDGAIYT